MSYDLFKKLYQATVHDVQEQRQTDGTDGNEFGNLLSVRDDADGTVNLGGGDDDFYFGSNKAGFANITGTVDMGDGEDTVTMDYDESAYDVSTNGDVTTITYVLSRDDDGQATAFGASVSFKGAENFVFNEGHFNALNADGNLVGTEGKDTFSIYELIQANDSSTNLGGGNDKFNIGEAIDTDKTFHVDMGEGENDVVQLNHTIEDYKIKVLDDNSISFTVLDAEGNEAQTVVFDNAEVFKFKNFDSDTGVNYTDDVFTFDELSGVTPGLAHGVEGLGHALQTFADIFAGGHVDHFDADGSLFANLHFDYDVA